jgi:endonuclease/exonuclease/phosphatase family metal-dependent hydrolase
MRLRVMTYNIHRAIGVDRRFRLDRIAGIIQHYSPDIALLQEVDRGAPRSGELDLAKELAELLEYPHYALGLNTSLRQGRWGNATLSRYPILNQSNIDLTVDVRKRRGCQHTTILAQKQTGHEHLLEVFNLHLGLSAWERMRQVGILTQAPEFASVARDAPCLIAGDFNDWRSMLHPVFSDVMGFDCVTHKAGAYQTSLRTYPSFSPRGGLDRIYYRGPLKSELAHACRLAVSKVASDHLPVIAEFELT